VETIRERTRWVVVFIIVAVGGEEILTLTVKQLAHRIRPAFNPAAATLGPSFPSGHSATSAVFYATAALLLGRNRGRPARAVFAGLAAAIALAVAGLTLGWAWFAVCSIAFGGRLLRFGAAAEQVVRTAHVAQAAPRSGSAATTRRSTGRHANTRT
jgi:undecaprenyl-diphosphatase